MEGSVAGSCWQTRTMVYGGCHNRPPREPLKAKGAAYAGLVPTPTLCTTEVCFAQPGLKLTT